MSADVYANAAVYCPGGTFFSRTSHWPLANTTSNHWVSKDAVMGTVSWKCMFHAICARTHGGQWSLDHRRA